MSTSDETAAPDSGTGQLASPATEPATEQEVAPEQVVAPDPSAEPPFTHTRASGLWAAVVVALLVLLVLLVFILENGHDAKVTFFGAHGNLPLGVALLLAAVFGGLVVVLAGTARILQLRRRARRDHKARSRLPARSASS